MKNVLVTAFAGLLLLSPIAGAPALAQERRGEETQGDRQQHDQQVSRSDGRHHAPWSRGQRLGSDGASYGQVDYRTEHLRKPARGQHWVRSDDGDMILAAVATGVIASVVLNHH